MTGQLIKTIIMKSYDDDDDDGRFGDFPPTEDSDFDRENDWKWNPNHPKIN